MNNNISKIESNKSKNYIIKIIEDKAIFIRRLKSSYLVKFY